MPPVPADGKSQLWGLRPFTKADIAAGYALDQICFLPGIAYSRSELRYFVSRPSAYAIAVEKAGILAGFLIAGHNARVENGIAQIVTLDVDPAYRRSGIASTLMQAAERHYLALGCTGIGLEVAVDNDAARAFYARQGFAATGLIPGYYDGMLDAIAMHKALVPAE